MFSHFYKRFLKMSLNFCPVTVPHFFQIASLEIDYDWYFCYIFCPTCEDKLKFTMKFVVSTSLNKMRFVLSLLLLLCFCCIKMIDFLFQLVCDIWKSNSHITDNAIHTELKSFSMSITTCTNVIMHDVRLLHELSGDNIIIVFF